jgi:hypothetical protein
MKLKFQLGYGLDQGTIDLVGLRKLGSNILSKQLFKSF